MSGLSSHVPDPRLLTTYAEHEDSPFHRVNAWTKVAVLALLVVAVTIADGLAAVWALYVAVLAGYAYAGLPVRKLLVWYTLPVIFVAAIAGPLAFGIGGRPMVELGPVSITWEGTATFVTLLGRGLTVVTYSLAIWMSTPYASIAHVLGRSLPSPIDQVALFAYRFTFVILEVVEDLLAGIHARGGRIQSDFWENRSLYGRIFGHTFIRSIERSEALLKSMNARGYHGDLAVYGHVDRPPARELLAVGAFALGIAVYAVTVAYGVMP
ncbi:cobalt ECF transporter T component CbiQ [Halapricum desulfuricans]|uniref:Energy-coupling factor transporter transmembrane protein EcfT n=1 Tax=Halapricum desulfuricans TaxID=2841257 RepID=A0A897NDS1_9EURY|nr:cobalt ECF transporter T component CbiQ [Halapricum desulfuricans]QSG09173.1 Energy-coupling factor transporter transmembrane protein EcfT [Halapricum desulfuricans]